MTPATPKPRAGEHTKGPWQWYWREESIDGVKRADCGIFHEKHLGHAYSVCRAPQYAKQDEWEANARRIVACVNACEGVENAELEDLAALKCAIPGVAGVAQMAILNDTLEAERDSLKEREKELVEALETVAALSDSGMITTGKPLRDAVEQARTLLAKHGR